MGPRTATEPASAAEAEMLYNIADYGNSITTVSKYLIPEGATVYMGKVAGGTGVQVYLRNPIAEGVELISTKPLVQYGF